MKKHCNVDGCGRRRAKSGLCKGHFRRLEKYGDVQADIPILLNSGPDVKTFEQKTAEFFSRITKTDTCWIWNGIRNPAGYGEYGKWRGRKMLAHRLSYLIHNGALPDGAIVCHTCDNPWCVNPDHLFLGTNGDNTQDALKKGRLPTGEKSYKAKLKESDVIFIRGYANDIPNKILAQRYGVTDAAIYNVRHFKTWKHLQSA
jgi:hypothetical protein